MNENLYWQFKYSHRISIKKYPEILNWVDQSFSNDILDSVRLCPHLLRFQENNNKIRRNLASLIVSFIKYNGKLAINRNSNYISDKESKWYTHDNALKAIELLEKEGIIKLEMKGYKNNNYEKGFASVYQATEKFNELFKDIEKQELEVEKDEIKDVFFKKIKKSAKKEKCKISKEILKKYFNKELKLNKKIYLFNSNFNKELDSILLHKDTRGKTEPYSPPDQSTEAYSTSVFFRKSNEFLTENPWVYKEAFDFTFRNNIKEMQDKSSYDVAISHILKKYKLREIYSII